MAYDILQFCGLRLKSDATGSDLDNASATAIEGNWDTPIAIRVDGSNRHMAFSDTEGKLDVWDLETSTITGDPAKVVNDYSTALTVQLYVDRSAYASGVLSEVVNLPDCVYNALDTKNRRLKAIGDRFVIEGSTSFVIFKSNS